MKIGYFTRVDHRGEHRSTRCHLVDGREYKPACKARLHPDHEFSWCAEATVYTVRHYVECKRCQELWRRSH